MGNCFVVTFSSSSINIFPSLLLKKSWAGPESGWVVARAPGPWNLIYQPPLPQLESYGDMSVSVMDELLNGPTRYVLTPETWSVC